MQRLLLVLAGAASRGAAGQGAPCLVACSIAVTSPSRSFHAPAGPRLPTLHPSSPCSPTPPGLLPATGHSWRQTAGTLQQQHLLLQCRALFTKVPKGYRPPDPQNHNPAPNRNHPGGGGARRGQRKPTLEPYLPQYLNGRYVIDRNGHVWHQPSNRKTKRRLKSANRLRRLKPLRAVYQAIASKLRKLSFGNKYFQTYREEHVPGFHGGQDQLGAAYAAPTDAIPLREARRKF